MGTDRSHRRTGGGGGALTDRRALVVPAVPSFSVDGGFRYAIPGELGEVEQGSMVRIPLGGRRVRGFVLEIDDGDTSGLKAIAARSGEVPVFDARLLEALRWAALHYVSPLSMMLERAAPPNNPRRVTASSGFTSSGGAGLDEVVSAGLDRRHVPITVVLAAHPPTGLLAATAARLLERGRSTVIVTATAHEAEAVFDTISGDVPGRAVVAHGDMSDRSITGAWSRAQAPAVVVGTPRVATWPIFELGMAVLIEEGRRAMKDRQTPTVHARDLLRARSQRERFPLVVTGPVPTTEVLAAGPRIVGSTGRLWGNVEVIDQRNEVTRGGVLTEPARRALAAVTRRGAKSFVFGHRRGYAAASRCVACRTLRRCAGCGSRPDPGEHCTRCGAVLGPCVECGAARFEPLGAGVGRLVAEVGRVVGSEHVGPAPTDASVSVGTERDVLDLGAVDLVVIPDLDGLLHGTNYRAAEDALRLTARFAGLVLGSGRRMMVQTSDPSHHVVRSLVRGEPLPALRAELDTRQTFSYPPAGELAILEVTDGTGDGIETLGDLCTVLGPAAHGDGMRWLLQGSDLSAAKTALRPIVQRWRDGGAKVRIDVDPIDL